MPRSAEKSQLSLGVLARPRKPNQRRLPIHPAHFDRIDHRIRHRIFLEHGYGAEFGATDDALAELRRWNQKSGTAHRRRPHHFVTQSSGRGYSRIQSRTSCLGWPHCVQDTALTQIAIDRRLTLIAVEAMNHWQSDGGFGLHVFTKTTNWPGIAPSCTPCSWPESPAATVVVCALRSSVSAPPLAARTPR